MIRGTAHNAALPDVQRKSVELVETCTVAEVVEALIPHAAQHVLDAARVTIHRDGQQRHIPRAMWGRVRPHSGCTVVVALPPEAGAVLGLVGAIANYITASIYYAGFTGLGIAGTNAVFLGVAGGFAALAIAGVNALIPSLPDGPDGKRGEDAYSLTGWRNQATPGEAIPLPLGRIRVAPMFASQPYTEIVGNDQYVRALFCFGYGPLDVSDIRIGDIPIAEVPFCQYELREGWPDDEPIGLVRKQVIEDNHNLELEGPAVPLDDLGNETDGEPEIRPLTVTTASNATQVTAIIRFPQGLRRITEDGDVRPRDVTVRFRQKLSGTDTWEEVATIVYDEKQKEEFSRAFTWDLPSRGRWDIEVARTSVKSNSTRIVDFVHLAALQSVRPEYPINFGKPLALLSLRLRASYRVNGTVDDLTAIVHRHVPDWTGAEWVEQPSSNPASVFAYALTANHVRKPADPSEVDWDALADWHAYCAANNLEYAYNHTDRMELREMLMQIAAAGRAAPRHDGSKWSVVIDRPRDFVSRHISPRNSRDFQGERSYFERPDGYRVRFRDRAEDFEEREIVIPWLGAEGATIDVAPQYEVRGTTDADEIQRRVYRAMEEAERRRDRWSVVMFDPTDVVDRGDAVRLSHYALSDNMVTGRVLAVSGQSVTLDELVTMEAGGSYGISWQHFDEADTVGSDRTAEVQTVEGETNTLRVIGATLPPVGELVSFGAGGMVTEDAIVLYVEPGSEGARVVHMTNAAQELDALAAAYVPRDFDGIVGEIVGTDDLPIPPVFRGVETSALAGDYGSTQRAVTVSAAADPDDLAVLATITVQHRINGESDWTETVIAGSAGTASVIYDDGDLIDLRLYGSLADGSIGGTTNVLTYTVGAEFEGLPATPDTSSIDVAGGLGYTAINLVHNDPDTVAIQVFRTPDGGALDTETDSVGIFAASPGTAVNIIDGDSSRSNLVSGLDFSGAAGTTVSHPLSMASNETYRGTVYITGRTAGTVQVTLSVTDGASNATGTLSDNGHNLFSLTQVYEPDTVSITYSADFDGTIALTLIRETGSSAPQGVFDYRFAALDADGISSAVSSEITTTII